jgi:hypothetical protein
MESKNQSAPAMKVNKPSKSPETSKSKAHCMKNPTSESNPEQGER